MLITIIDYGLGNLRSISNAIKKFNAEPLISSKISDIENSDGIILPGVGAFKDAIINIEPLRDTIIKEVKQGKPTLGICLGLQLLFTESTEGGFYKGLDFLKGRVVKLPDNVKVPHIGWNTIEIVDKENPLVKDIKDGGYFYFVHSYYAEKTPPDNLIALTDYGVVIPAIVSSENVYATQFHPEKSSDNGLKIIENFLRIVKEG